jgi:hypothetical protein
VLFVRTLLTSRQNFLHSFQERNILTVYSLHRRWRQKIPQTFGSALLGYIASCAELSGVAGNIMSHIHIHTHIHDVPRGCLSSSSQIPEECLDYTKTTSFHRPEGHMYFYLLDAAVVQLLTGGCQVMGKERRPHSGLWQHQVSLHNTSGWKKRISQNVPIILRHGRFGAP